MVINQIRVAFLWFEAVLCFCLAVPKCQGADNVTEAIEWDRLFQNENGWLGADGIYSVPVTDKAHLGSIESKDKNPIVLLLFSDTIFGTTKNDGKEFQSIQMANHSMAILKGGADGYFTPDKFKIQFLYPSECRKPEDNLLGRRCWLQQGVVIQNSLLLTALTFNPKSWKPERVDLVRLPLDSSGAPLFNPEIIGTKDKRAQSNRFSCLTYLTPDNERQFVWGAGLYDDPDEDTVYIFGYLDNYRAMSRKDLIAARAPRAQLGNLDTWRFYDGQNWRTDPMVCSSNDALLAKGISSEFSVSRIPAGPCKGKYLLVYTPGGISDDLEYRVGKSPVGPFEKPVRFYRSNVPEQLGKGIFCYNGKGQPALSRPDALLVSYNVNRLGAIAKKPAEYRPRFVWLPYESICNCATTP